MAQWQPYPEDDEDDGDDAWRDAGDPPDADRLSAAEWPDPADTDRPGDDRDTVPCPFCGRAVYEFADVCPRCRNFIGGSDETARRKPWWVVVGIVLTLAAMLLTCAIRMW